MMEIHMNKLMISMLTLMLVAGVASSASFAKQRKYVDVSNAETKALAQPKSESRKVILELREQHRLDEKNDVNG
jgi:uncharacterized membrane protein YjgN (DUF898 family)